MSRVELGKIDEKANQDEFWSIRGKAVGMYAQLEHAQLSLFTHLTKMEPKVAAIVFYKITNARNLASILEKLVKIKFSDNFKDFFESLFRHFGTIAQDRNEIVHWTHIVESDVNGDNVSIYLRHGTYPTSQSENSKKIDSKNMIDFCLKCDFFSRLINVFEFCYLLDLPSAAESQRDERTAFSDIFQKSIQYPPQADHPLLRPAQKSPIPPEAFQA